MWSLILYVVCVCTCMYVVFCKIDHCIHIHWCIVMGLGHNDPWVESHVWPQQTWGQRSSRGQWPLVQVFGKKGQCIHILWSVFSNLMLQWLQKYVIAKSGETRGSRTALLSKATKLQWWHPHKSNSECIFVLYDPLWKVGCCKVPTPLMCHVKLNRGISSGGHLAITYTAKLLWPAMWYPIKHSYCNGTYTEVTVLLLWGNSAVTMEYPHRYSVGAPVWVLQGSIRATSKKQLCYFSVGTSAVTV